MSGDIHRYLSNNMVSRIINQMGPCVVSDSEGRYLYVNDLWEQSMDSTLEEIKGKYIKDFVPESRIMDCINQKKTIVGKIVGKKNGIDLHSTYIPIFDEMGQLECVLIYVVAQIKEKSLDMVKRICILDERMRYYEKELSSYKNTKYSIDDIIGESNSINELKNQIIKASKTKSNILIFGETGTGKELVAHSIHDLSSRRKYPFIKTNCAAIPENLFESELFGYVKGAFTGASREGKIGKFQQANEGTIFLDEINQMPVPLQSKILRVLQESEIERIGSTKTESIDARFIFATNVDLEKAVINKEFRKDLFYRINVFKITVPPLRERLEDIPILTNSIVTKLNFEMGMNVRFVNDDVYKKFMEYSWPGNVRELQNVIERAMNYSMGESLSWEHFEEYFNNKNLKNQPANTLYFNIPSINKKIIENEKELYLIALQNAGGNKTKAAKLLGISRTKLYYKLKELGIK